MNLIIAIKVWVSSPPIGVLTTQTALTDRQNIIYHPYFTTTLPKFGGKKAKATINVTLYESPIRISPSETYYFYIAATCLCSPGVVQSEPQQKGFVDITVDPKMKVANFSWNEVPACCYVPRVPVIWVMQTILEALQTTVPLKCLQNQLLWKWSVNMIIEGYVIFTITDFRSLFSTRYYHWDFLAQFLQDILKYKVQQKC